MKRHLFPKHLLALVLAVCMVLQCGPVLGAAEAAPVAEVTVQEISGDQISADLSSEALAPETQAPAAYADEELVRVSIVLQTPSALEKGFSATGIGGNAAIRAYRSGLAGAQQAVAARISRQVLGGQSLDVEWNLTLAANLISANVPYGCLEQIRQVSGVKAVYLERRYEIEETEKGAQIENVTAGAMTGTPTAWASGYTGAGTRIAVIDTGTDTDHQSLDAGAYLYSLYLNGAQAVKDGKFATVDEYIASLDLLDMEELMGYYDQLNAYQRYPNKLTPQDLYLNEKLPYAFNYVDADLDVTHDNDEQTEHGSHVAGIALANAYIPDGLGGYKTAIDSVYVVGQAPDAQLITMKVGGKAGGIYDSDYMAAIEDALVLGCDAVNMSFGSTSVGYSYSGNDYFDAIYENLTGTDTVLSNSGGNAYSYAEFAANGVPYLFADDVNNGRIGSPSAYPNALSVASVDNTGFTGPTTTFQGQLTTRVDNAGNAPAGFRMWNTLDLTQGGEGTEYEFVFLGNPAPMLEAGYEGEDLGNYYGVAEDFEGLDLTGKIVMVARGNGVAFSDKHSFGALAGATAVLVYNNQTANISMDISASTSTIPCASMSLADAITVWSLAEVQEDGSMGGTLLVKSAVSMIYGQEDAPMTMSVFSSHGVPDSLTMKPEITAPGGNIYSLYGSTPSGGGSDQYEVMSGTSMSAPQITGMSALLISYLEQAGLPETTGLSARTLAQSLLMSTAEPIIEEETGLPYAVRRQGAGLASIDKAIASGAYLLMGEDGKIKAEFGDDPAREGVYELSFQICNISDKTQSYELVPSIMAPGVASDGVNLYMLNSMVPLSALVDYSTSADPDLTVWYDFDGSGLVDNDDAQILLDLLAGNVESIEYPERADLSGNGALDAYDAHLLMEYVARGENAPAPEIPYIDVPAGETVTVDVRIELSEEDRAYIDSYFPNGTYVEGFIRLISQADAEGALDVDHSVPLLGFYGGWSEGSMYDRGEWTSDYYAAVSGSPNAHYTTTGLTANYMLTKVDGQQLYYGLNLYTDDAQYLPERASLSAAKGSAISRIVYNLIRNSAETKVLITDDETGEVYLEQSFGQQLAAFYYTNAGAWSNTNLAASINWKGTDLEGNQLPDGTRATIRLISASEYYRNADGSIRWEELDEGACYAMPVLIDNEAPVVDQAVQINDALSDLSLLSVTVTDNHYLAALSVYNATGSRLLGIVSPDQTEEGQTQDFNLELNVIGTNFLLGVHDYAGNSRYYEITVKVDSSSGGFYAFNTATDSWVNFGSDVDANETVVATAASTFVAGDYAQGYLFALDNTGGFYAMRMSDMSDARYIKNLNYSYLDLAYDDASGVLYGLRNYGNGRSYLYSISLANAGERYVRTLQADLQSLASVGDGSFYGITSAGELCLIDETGLSVLFELGMTVEGSQATTYSDGGLYWARGSELLFVDLSDGSISAVGTLSSVTTCLVNSLTADEPGDSSQVTGLSLNQSRVEIFLGGQLYLEATVRPWYAKDRSVTWSSSDETVASVDENGVVSAQGLGTAVITATSNLSPEVSASCTVTVNALDLVLTAVTNHNGGGALFFRDMTTGEGGITAVQGLADVVAATYDTDGGRLWAMDESGSLLELDETSGTVLSKVPAGGGMIVTDIEHSQLFGGYFSVAGSWLMVPTGYDENAPTSGFDLGQVLAQNSGGTALVSVASMGRVVNSGDECEMLLCMDNTGTLWQILPYANGNSYGAYLGIVSTGLAGKIPGTSLNSSVYLADYGTAGGLLLSLSNGNGTSSMYIIDAGNTMNVLQVGTLANVPMALYLKPAAEADGSAPESLPLLAELLGESIQAQPVQPR